VRSDPLEARAFNHYVEIIRSGKRDAYAAFRVYERYFKIPGSQADRIPVLRKAVLILLEEDPWFVASDALFVSDAGLSFDDVKRLAPTLARAGGKSVAYLQARLWFHGAGGRWRPDPKPGLRKAMQLLAKVPARQRGHDWVKMLTECHERLGNWREYARWFPRLLAATEPEWRTAPLLDMLRFAARCEQWRAYDRWRREWDQLPSRRHSCECETNDVGTFDGLRAVAAKRWDEIPSHLAAAAAVRGGCPHLNSYGFRLELVRALLKKNRHLDACSDYLTRGAHFASSPESSQLRQQIGQALLMRARPRSAPRRRSTGLRSGGS
jgi:hypothetical protein